MAAQVPQKKVVKKVIKKVVKKPVAKTINKLSEYEAKAQKIRESVREQDRRNAPIKKEFLSSDVPLEKANLRLYLISIALGVTIILITAGVFVAKGRIAVNVTEVQDEEVLQVEEETVIETVELEETEEEVVVVLEREDITLEILNGSGISGAAGDTQEEFEDLGYTVESIGNADEQTGNTLFVSNEYNEDELEQLLKDVKRRLDIDEITGSIKNLDTVARIVLGS